MVFDFTFKLKQIEGLHVYLYLCDNNFHVKVQGYVTRAKG